MEPFIADLINNPKVPKILRYGIVTTLSICIIFISIVCAINSPFRWGKVLGVILVLGS